jgi:peptidoglycan hydrolase-like protein with peptidoglycan-binding domain
MRRLWIGIVVLTSAGALCGEAAALAKVQVPGLQVALYRYGYYKGPIDGIAGPMTKRAIREFQRASHLEPDGVAGKRTRAQLGRFGRPLFGARTLKRGTIGLDVSVLQFLLAKHGLPPPKLNSNFGPVTEKLVRRYQRKIGLPPDGVVGRRTRAALLSPGPRRHVVRPGETLTSIAARTGTTVQALARRNRLEPRKLLLVGTALVVPKPRSPASRAGVRASIARWASHYGVSADLARALAWQESGFQTNVRSAAGAVGVMQVTPATWEFVERFVIGERVPRTVDGNVRVGVAYLDHLLEEFRGKVRRALGAYYQGPASIRRDGLFPVTRRFVANVLALRGRV